MAGNTKNSRSGGSRSNKKTSSNTRKRNVQTRVQEPLDNTLVNEILLIVVFAVCVLLFLCNFGIVGDFGKILSDIQFGLFGLLAYPTPVLFFVAMSFSTINQGSSAAKRKLIAGIVLFFLLGMVCELLAGNVFSMEKCEVLAFYKNASQNHNGGGLFAGLLTYFSYKYLATTGTVLLIIVAGLICIVLLTEKSIIRGAKESGRHLAEASREDNARRREEYEMRRMQNRDRKERLALEREEKQRDKKRIQEEKNLEKRLKAEEAENEEILRRDKKVRGVSMDLTLTEREKAMKVRDDMHEITVQDMDYNYDEADYDEADIIVEDDTSVVTDYRQMHVKDLSDKNYEESIRAIPEPVTEFSPRKVDVSAQKPVEKQSAPAINQSSQITQKKTPVSNKKYVFPPLSLLQKGNSKNGGNSSRELKETALRLQETLKTFGVKVTVTDISQGPSVTRYELQPEQGVKVSKIVGLADDIKLNLAATDIRIEAPIPGKAAVGIEVPNKENATVCFRDLLETKAYKDFSSKLVFAVGKDIGGQTVVTDIAKMPHMLIAGSTGSGKSVCINTIIMSILYKAHPDEVKLIMIDPKVVELSVYNGIPHLLIPVVTDPKKAAGALHWGVAEMTERYNKFAELNVRDLKGYNQKAAEMRKKGVADAPQDLPQILIIVDELADLMMVAPGEVEESICRLAQLARAAGIHLIIATQRPSVDVITGLIKANMPSRVAFAVSSGVDSRTILDMNGAEKLLGKGDMLFYPQGYPKPARIQGAFISDREVQDVVDFLKDQNVISSYQPDIEGQMKSVGAGSSSGGYEASSNVDEYFVDAGKFIIDKDKASIGMLQRVFKIGFNRAARIMDQLYEAGVVGEEEGTKPRKVLMSMEQFESYIEESL